MGNAFLTTLIAASLVLITAVILGIQAERKDADRSPTRRARRRAANTKADAQHTPRVRARAGAGGGR